MDRVSDHVASGMNTMAPDMQRNFIMSAFKGYARLAGFRTI